MPASIEQVTKLAPAEALRGSTQGQVDDVLSGKRYLNAAMRLEGIAEVPPATAAKNARGSSSGVDQVQAPACTSGLETFFCSWDQKSRRNQHGH